MAPILVRLRETGLIATAFWRILLALPYFWFMASVQRRKSDKKVLPKDGKAYGLLFLAGFFFAMDLNLWHWSIHLTAIANATLLTNFAPVIVTLGSWYLFRTRIRGLFLVGMFTALVGSVLVIGQSLSFGSERLLGDLLGLLSAFFYGAYQLTVKHLRKQFDTSTIMAISGVGCLAVFLPASLLTETGFFAVTLRGWLVLIALALAAQIGGQNLIVFALAKLPAHFSSVSLLLQPTLATIWAWAIFGETLTPVQGLGALIVLLGIYLSRQGSVKE